MKKIIENLLQLQELEFADVSASETEAAITKLRAKVPLPILKHYDRLTDHGKKGVAIVRHQVCTGCHMTIPIGAIVTLMRDLDIQTCENCGRYLYLPSEAPGASSEAAAPAAVAAKPAKAKRKTLVRAA